MIDFLLSKSIDLDFRDEHGNTASEIAYFTGKTQVLKIFKNLEPLNEYHKLTPEEKAFIQLRFKILYRNQTKEITEDFINFFENNYNPYNPSIKGKHNDLLHIAIKNDDKNMIEFLLSKSIDLELKDEDGKTALEIAADTKKIKIVKKLLFHGAERNKDKSYELRSYVINRDPKKDIPVDFTTFFIASYDPYNCFEQGKHNDLLHIAIRNKDIKMINFLLYKRINLELKDEDGKTALEILVNKDKIELEKLLLLHGADSNFRKSEVMHKSELNPLINSINHLNVEGVENACNDKTDLAILDTEGKNIFDHLNKILRDLDNLKQKVESDPNDHFKYEKVRYEINKDKYDAIILIIHRSLRSQLSDAINNYNCTKIKKLTNLLTSANEISFSNILTTMDEGNKREYLDGGSLLHFAAIFNDPELIHMLREHETTHQKIFTKYNSNNDTPLHIAVRLGNKEVIKTLLTKYPKFINKKNKSGQTALDIAMFQNDKDMVNEIVKNSARFEEQQWLDISLSTGSDGQKELSIQDDRVAKYIAGDTPLHLAVKLANIQAIKKILFRNPKMFYLQNSEGKTPIEEAILYHDKNILELLINKAQDIEPIFEIQEDFCSDTPNFEIAKDLLFAKKHDLYIKAKKTRQYLINSDHDTLLHEMLKYNNTKAIKALYAKDQTILTQKNNNGETALHVAAQHKNIEGIKAILELDKNNELINIKNNNGETALDIAIKTKNTDVAYAILDSKEGIGKVVSESNSENLVNLQRYKQAYRIATGDDIDPQTFNTIKDNADMHFICCIALINGNKPLIKKLKSYKADVMDIKHGYYDTQVFSPNDLELFLGNAGCLTSLRKSILQCFGIKYPIAKDFEGLLYKIWPFKESKLLMNAGVERPPYRITSFVTTDSNFHSTNLQSGYDIPPQGTIRDDEQNNPLLPMLRPAQIVRNNNYILSILDGENNESAKARDHNFTPTVREKEKKVVTPKEDFPSEPKTPILLFNYDDVPPPHAHPDIQPLTGPEMRKKIAEKTLHPDEESIPVQTVETTELKCEEPPSTSAKEPSEVLYSPPVPAFKPVPSLTATDVFSERVEINTNEGFIAAFKAREAAQDLLLQSAF